MYLKSAGADSDYCHYAVYNVAMVIINVGESDQ